MHLFFMLARIYPYWAIPGAFIFAELGIYFRRRRNPNQYLFWGLVAFLAVGFIFWAVYRGDLNSDEWVRSMIQ